MKTCSKTLLVLCGSLLAFSPLVLVGQTPAAPAKTADLSAGLAEIVKLSESGVAESVILAFIQSSTVAYHPSADEIIKLHELGVTTPIITAMLRRGSAVRQDVAKAQQDAASVASVPNNPPAAPPASNVQPPAVYYTSPPASPPAVYESYPSYSYAATVPYYPYYYGGYGYPSYYSSYYYPWGY